MKKIGFIDYFIDEWHANNYPRWIRESSFGDRFDVALAWEETTPEGKMPLDQWCREQNVTKAESLEQVVDECDYIVVLSPDNAERHEDLADLPLRSGKPVYIDKTFAPDFASAKRTFDKAHAHNTPLMSSSALRFGSAIEEAVREKIAGAPVHFVSTFGPGAFSNYSVHQLEMLVMTIGPGATRVMQCGNEASEAMLIDYPDPRRALVHLSPGYPFRLIVHYGDAQTIMIDEMTDFFPRFIEAMLAFFDTGASPVPSEQTLEIIALVEAANKALGMRDQWVKVPG